MEILDNTILKQDDSILSTELEGEMLMMSIEQGEYYSVNSVGGRIFTLLETPTTFQELCSKLASEFDIEQQTCQKETTEFIRQMCELGIVKTYEK